MKRLLVLVLIVSTLLTGCVGEITVKSNQTSEPKKYSHDKTYVVRCYPVGEDVVTYECKSYSKQVTGILIKLEDERKVIINVPYIIEEE